MKKFMATIVSVATMTACTISANAVKEVPKGFTMAYCVQRAKEVELERGRITCNIPIYLGDTTSRYWIAFHDERVVLYHENRSWYDDVEYESEGLFVLGCTE